MALTDILIPEGDPQNGILEIPTGSTLTYPDDILSDDNMNKIVAPATISGFGGG